MLLCLLVLDLHENNNLQGVLSLSTYENWDRLQPHVTVVVLDWDGWMDGIQSAIG